MKHSVLFKHLALLALVGSTSLSMLTGCGSKTSSTSVKATQEPVIDKHGETQTFDVISKYSIYTSSDVIDRYYVFDYDDNNLATVKGYDSNGLGIYYKLTLDSNYDMTQFNSFDADDSPSGYYKLDLGSNGLLKSEHQYSSSDEETYRYDYEYNSDGLLTSKTGYTNGTDPSTNMKYSYDDNGNILRRTNYSSDGEETSYIEYAYKDNNLINEKYITTDGTVYYTYKYAYDKNGNCIKACKYEPDKKKPSLTTKYKYDKNRNKTAEYNYDKSGKLTDYTKIKYTTVTIDTPKPWYYDWITDWLTQ